MTAKEKKSLQKLRDDIKSIVDNGLEPRSPPYWDDGAALLEDEVVDKIIRRVRRALK